MDNEKKDTKRIRFWKEFSENGIIALGVGGSLALNGFAMMVLVLALFNKWLSWELSKNEK